MKRKVLSVLLAASMVATMAMGCGSNSSNNQAADTDAAPVTLKLFSNLPDRKNGQGLVEQMIIDEYMEQNPNVTIEVEALDEEPYKVKFKAYSMEGMPDVVSIWGQPRNTDVAGVYYNQKMFEDNGWEVPKTYDELLELAGTISAAGVTPLAMDGGDGWPLAVYLSDLLFKVAGSDYSTIVSNAVANGDFTDPAFKTASDLLRKAAEAGLFQNGFDTQDYGTAQNLFTNGQAAMFYMGSWEASMALNEDIPEEIRNNIRVFTMPTVFPMAVMR